MLEGKVTLVHIARGSVICKQGDVEKFLTFVVSGHLEVTQRDIHENEEVCLVLVHFYTSLLFLLSMFFVGAVDDLSYWSALGTQY